MDVSLAERGAPPVRGARGGRASDGRPAPALIADVPHAASAGREGLVGLASSGLGDESVLQVGLLLLGDDVGAVTRRGTDVSCAAAARVGHLARASQHARNAATRGEGRGDKADFRSI
jgi:hypothetical protein